MKIVAVISTRNLLGLHRTFHNMVGLLSFMSESFARWKEDEHSRNEDAIQETKEKMMYWYIRAPALSEQTLLIHSAISVCLIMKFRL